MKVFMNHEVIISAERHNYLLRCEEAFEAIKKDEKFIHISTWATMGGSRLEVTSNDERIQQIKDGIMKDHEDSMARRLYDLKKAQDELKLIKSRGFFKRLFS